MSDIGDRIKQARKALGISQHQAAKEWGVSVQAIRHWEQGRHQPSKLALRALETILAEAERGDAGHHPSGYRGA